ncbi:MAG: hypothetical protein GTN89_13130 [Acidobacteria bacterium]|nr:hypothetical protein [Acidobacteriota bacterium]
MRRRTARPFEERLDRQRLRRLLRRTADLLDVAVPLRRISFVPDSLVGEIEIEVGGRRRTLYFHPEPDDLPGPEDIDAETVEDLTDRLVRSARPPEPDEGILDE